MPTIPKPKPYTEEMFQKDSDLYIKGYLGGFDKDEMTMKLNNVISKIKDSGVMSSDEAKDFIKDRAEIYKKFSKERPGETLPDFKAMGGRIGFLKGGDTAYNKMVTEAYIKAGGLEATGMDIDSFANEYFKKFNKGGRVNYDEGTQAPDTMALRKRVEELMDDGETFGDAVKQAVKEIGG